MDESHTTEEETADSPSDKSIRKSDDASSVADSAIATSIATFTDQVSQYSEVGDKMTSYIVITSHWL